MENDVKLNKESDFFENQIVFMREVIKECLKSTPYFGDIIISVNNDIKDLCLKYLEVISSNESKDKSLLDKDYALNKLLLSINKVKEEKTIDDRVTNLEIAIEDMKYDLDEYEIEDLIDEKVSLLGGQLLDILEKHLLEKKNIQ